MLFCHVAGAGGRGTVNRADVPRRRSPRPGCARTPGAAGAIFSPPPASGPEWGPQGAGRRGPAPDQASPPYHSSDPAPDAPTSHPSAGDGQLSGDDAVGSRDRLLLRFLSRRRNHRPPLIGLRRKGAPLLGRRRYRRHGRGPAGVPQALED